MQQNLKKEAKFLKHIKIRIGEPLTAIYTSKNKLAFGAISGYVGCYDYKDQSLSYVSEVFEEIIRGIFIKDSNETANILVGDFAVLELHLKDMNNKDKWAKHYFENHENKKPSQCASTITFLSKYSVAILMAAANQRREKEDNEQINQLKKEINVYTIYKENYNQVEDDKEDEDIVGDLVPYKLEYVPDVYVPFDFDGLHIVWLEYGKNNARKIQKLTLQTNVLEQDLIVIDKKVKFISHVKILRNFIVYVVDHQKVIAFDTLNKKSYDLYSHSYIIQTIDIKSKQNQNDQTYDLEKQQEFGDDKPNIKLDPITIDDLIICSIDTYMNLKIYELKNITTEIALLKLPDLPEEIKKQNSLFDMGYPYYISYRYDRVAFTTDLGALCFQL